MGLSLMKNHLIRCWICLSLHNLIGTSLLSLFLKLPPRELDLSMKFFCSEVALYLYRSIIQLLYKQCSCHVWVDAPNCSKLDIDDRLQKRVCRTIDLTLAPSLELLTHLRIVASLSVFCRYNVLLNRLNLFHVLVFVGGTLVILVGFFLSPFLDVTGMYLFVNNFFVRTARLWNSLPAECFLLSYD